MANTFSNLWLILALRANFLNFISIFFVRYFIRCQRPFKKIKGDGVVGFWGHYQLGEILIQAHTKCLLNFILISFFVYNQSQYPDIRPKLYQCKCKLFMNKLAPKNFESLARLLQKQTYLMGVKHMFQFDQEASDAARHCSFQKGWNNTSLRRISLH